MSISHTNYLNKYQQPIFQFPAFETGVATYSKETPESISNVISKTVSVDILGSRAFQAEF